MSNECITVEELQTLYEVNGLYDREKMLMGEWVVAPDLRTIPNRKEFSIPANEAEMIRDSFAENDQVRIRMSLSYENVKKMMLLLEEAEASGELMIPNDEVILDARIDMSRSQTGGYPSGNAGLCTPSRNGYLTYADIRS